MTPWGPLLSCLICVATTAESWTLPETLRYARTNAPDSRIARLRIASAAAVMEQAQSAYWPSLRVQSSYTRTDNPGAVFGMILNQRSYSTLDFNHVPEADDLNVRGIATVPLYAGGRNKAGRQAATAEAQAVEADAEATRNLLEYEVVRSCAVIATTKRFVEAAEASVQAFETNRFLAQSRLSAGSILRPELLDVQVRLGAAREELIRARNSAALASLSLKRLLGLEQKIEIDGSRSGLELPRDLKVDAHPELRSILARMRAAAAEIRRAGAGYLPRVEAFGQVEHDLGFAFDGNGQSYAGGVVAQWDLWDGHRTRGKVREAQALYAVLHEEYAKLKQGLELDAEQARLKLQEAEERLEVTGQSTDQAEESVRLIRARFEQGMALATQLIDAETALTAARVHRAEAEADRLIAIAALRKACGLAQLEGLLNL